MAEEITLLIGSELLSVREMKDSANAIQRWLDLERNMFLYPKSLKHILVMIGCN